MTTYIPERGAALDIRNGANIAPPKKEVDSAVFMRKIQQYKLLTSIKHDGKDIPEGALIDLNRSEAESLLSAGAIELVIRHFDAKIFAPGAQP